MAAPKGTGITYAVVGRGSGKVVKSGVRAGVSPTSTNPRDVRARQYIERRKGPTPTYRAAPAQPKNEGLSLYRSPKGAVDIRLSKGATGALKSLSSTDKMGAPQNVGQWLINFLSTGAYAVGEGGYRSNGLADQATRQIGRGDIGNGIESFGRGAGEFLRGVGTGIAEGFGARPEKRAPITPSQVLNGRQDLSLVTDEETLREQQKVTREGGFNGQFLDKVNGDRVVDNGSSGVLAEITKKGLLNFAEDAILDPGSYVTVGAGAAVKGGILGATKGARAAAEAAEAAGKVASRGAKFAGAVKGGLRGAHIAGKERLVDGALGPQRQVDTFRVRAKARRDARRAARSFDEAAAQAAEMPQAPTAARVAAPAAIDAPTATAVREQAVKEAIDQEVAAREVPAQAAVPEPEVAAPREATPRVDVEGPAAAVAPAGLSRADAVARDAAVRGAVDEINGPLGRIAIDPDPIVRGMFPEGSGGTITRERAQALQDLATGPVADIGKRIKEAARADAGTAAVLKLKTDMVIGGEKATVARLIERIATKRATGVSSPVAAAALKMDQAALAKALRSALPQRGRPTPETLQASLDAAGVEMPEGLGIQDLFDRVGAARSPQERAQVLKDALEREQGARFATVEDALQAAVGGELTVPQMRQIAKALGISTAKTRDTMQQILSDRALPAWREIQDALDTPEEVAAAHGIAPESLVKAQEVDLPAVQAQAADALENVQRTALDEVLDKPGRSASREMIDQVVASIGHQLVKNDELIPGATEAFGMNRWLDQWRAATRTFRKTTGNLLKDDLVGRSKAADARIMMAMEAGEDYARSIGVFPRISYELEKGADRFGGPVFASIGQVLRELPEDVRRAAFFPEGISMADVERGITLYPTTFANGLRRALTEASSGSSTGEIAASFRAFIEAEARLQTRGRMRNEWVSSPQGQRALDDLAVAVSQPSYLNAIRAIHDATEPLAVRAASDGANAVTQPALAGLVEIISRGGPDMRREVQELVAKARREADALRQGTGGADNLMSDLSHQRLTAGLIDGILGPDGVKQLRAEERLVKSSEPREVTERAIEAAEQGRKRHEPPAAQAEFLTKAADDAARDAADMEDDVIDAVREVNAYREDTDVLSDIETLAEARTQTGALSTAFDAMGVGLSGSYGMGQRLKAALMRGESISQVSATQFTELMRKNVRSWGKRLQPELRLNRPATYAEVSAMSRTWINAIARLPRNARDVEVQSLLQDGGLSAAQAKMAYELKVQIDSVFGSSLGRSRVLAKDLHAQMSRAGGVTSLPDPRQPLRDQATIWKQWGADDTVDPLDTLNRWSHAIKMAQVTPNVAHAAERMFGHEAMGMTAAEAKAAGWKRINTRGPNADLAKHFSPDTYFDPDTIRRLSYVQNFLRASARFETPVLKQAVGAYDMVLRVLKSAATVWRPGHHITNILGEIGVNLMDGVSPLNTVRALQMMRKSGSLLDADWSILERADFGGATNPKYLTGDVIVTINGKGVHVSLEDLYKEAIASGVAQTHSTARDLADPLVQQLNRSKLDRTREVLGKPDEALGKFSAARDNVTRLAHYISILERRPYRSLDEAFNAAATRVHDFHPSFLTLSMGERKYARRIFYFYTWQRQAISLILRTAMDKPGLVTMPSKLQYGFAEANGLNPESFGQVQNDDPRLPSYYQDTLLGPSWRAGNTAFSDPAEVEASLLRAAGIPPRIASSMDEAIAMAKKGELSIDQSNALLRALGDNGVPYKNPKTIAGHLDTFAGKYWQANRNGNLWGLSLSQPQIDTLQSLFSGATLGQEDKNPGVETFRQVGIGNLAPTLRAPVEITAQKNLQTNKDWAPKYDGQAPSMTTDRYLFNQLGAPSQIAKLLPSKDDPDGNGESVYQEMFPSPSDPYQTKESNADERQRALLNFLLGIKLTNYTNGAAQAARRNEDKAAGITP